MLPGARDAPALLGACVIISIIIAICIRTGRALGGYGTLVRREDQPSLFWTMIGVLGAFLFACVFMTLMAIAPWPPGAGNWAAPNTNPDTSLSDP